MKFPGKRKNKHYFPVGDKKRVPINQEIFENADNIYICGIEQLIVDVEVNVDDAFLNKYGIKKGESMVFADDVIEKIYQELKNMGAIVGEYPGGTIGNTLHNYSILSDDNSIMLGAICRNISVGDYAFKYVCNTCSHVDFSYLKPCDGQLARCICFVTPDCERSFALSRGISNDLDSESIKEEVIKGSSCLLLTAYVLRDETAPIFDATMTAVKIAKANNVPVCLTMGTSSLVAEKKEFLTKFISEYVNVVAMNDAEAYALVGENDSLLACEKALEFTDLILLTVGAEGLFIAGWIDEKFARLTKDVIHSKSIPAYNKHEYSRAMLKERCEKPIKIYTHINPYMGGPGLSIKNTNGAGDAALSAVLHDIASNAYHKATVPNSPKHIADFLLYSSIHQVAKYANRVSYEVLRQSSPRLTRALPEKEDCLEESYWEM